MTSFYLLPPRSYLGQRLAIVLRGLFPGQEWSRGDWADLAEGLAAAFAKTENSFVLFSDDVAEDAPLDEVLQRDFGAQPGDEIVSVRLGATLSEVSSHAWLLGKRAA
jgi:hypothetical protein